MHVFVITQYFWPEDFRINELAAGLVERGHRVTVLTGIPNYPQGHYFSGYGLASRREENYRGCRVIRVPLLPRGNSRGYQLALNYLSFALAATVMAPWKSDDSVDAILVCQLSPATVGIPAIVLKWLRRRPMMLWVLDLWPESLSATGAVSSRLVLGLVRRMVAAIYRSSDLILASSRAFIPHIEKMGGREGIVRHFPNWAEEPYNAQPVSTAAAYPRVPADAFKVMFAGNIGRAQNFETIVAAAELLKSESDIHWLVVGDGRMRPWVQQQIIERKLERTVHLLGRHPHEEMPGYFALADALLVTLSRDPLFSLTAPGKLQSYLASGKLIVGALDGEGRRVIEESGAGLVCPPEDPGALAEAVLSASRMPVAARASMGEAGKRYCSAHFRKEPLIDSLDHWLQEIVAGCGSR